VGDAQDVINFEQSEGMQWITVKCGDGTNIWTQFTSDLVTRAHAAGLKIFAWAYVYGGSDVPGEINVALNALNLGADGFIIDAETEYEAAGQSANAVNYCKGIRAVYPTRFMAHSPFPIITDHSTFPYVQFGTYCNAVMPQDYWADIGGTNYAATMVARMNTEWINWQNSLNSSETNAIKPIAPIGQGYNSVSGNVDGTQIAAFFAALQTSTPMATPGGFHGVSFWSCQDHGVAPNKWPAIGAISFPPAQPAQFQGIAMQPDSSLLLTATGQPNATYIVETSTDLTNWTTLTNLVATNGQFTFNAGSPTNGAQRFFRARSGP
jgi:hypothetical protein